MDPSQQGQTPPAPDNEPWKAPHPSERGLLRGWRLRSVVEGRENIPPVGSPLIVLPNHIHHQDPVHVGRVLIGGLARGLFLIMTGRRRLLPSYMAKRQLFDNPRWARFLRFFGAFPVDRGERDLSALDTATQVLLGNRTLVIFPEGTRSRPGEQVLPPHPGAALTVLDALSRGVSPEQLTMLPVAVWVGAHGRRHMRIGKPYHPPFPVAGKHLYTKTMAHEMMARTVALLPEEHRGADWRRGADGRPDGRFWRYVEPLVDPETGVGLENPPLPPALTPDNVEAARAFMTAFRERTLGSAAPAAPQDLAGAPQLEVRVVGIRPLGRPGDTRPASRPPRPAGSLPRVRHGIEPRDGGHHPRGGRPPVEPPSGPGG